ncbi:MAG: hypothetical protein WCA37_06765 [Terracidiphilus sp.]
MIGIGIALALLMVWALGLACVGAYWIRRERREANKKRNPTPYLPFPSLGEMQGTYLSRFSDKELATTERGR